MLRMKWFLALTAAAWCAWADPKTEIGEINAAQYRIDLPDNWNGVLVMYCHGYNAKPGVFREGAPNQLIKVFLDKGFAVAQSGYAAGGWAIQEAVVDTESLRRHFVKKFGAAKETYVMGHSMGGFLTMTLMEQFPTVYDGGLPLCGPLAPTLHFMARGAFDGRVLFDYYFPGELPGLLNIPAAYVNTREESQRIEKLLDAHAEKAAVLRRFNGHKSNRDLAGALTFTTYIIKELLERAGGNPFDNRSIIYHGSADDNALNAGVKRYTADPKAVAYLRAHYTPTGKISRPMLAIHTSYDPVVPTWIPNVYQSIADQAGTSQLFVQQYVKRDGHCTITPQETWKGFESLLSWKAKGERPAGGDLAAGQ
jgi:pimeloyl-ACP methyl ester carboxylesterase